MNRIAGTCAHHRPIVRHRNVAAQSLFARVLKSLNRTSLARNKTMREMVRGVLAATRPSMITAMRAVAHEAAGPRASIPSIICSVWSHQETPLYFHYRERRLLLSNDGAVQ